MNISMFSRSHFRSVEKAATVSKRIQERQKEDEPAKPMSVCLISTSLNKGQSSSVSPDVSNIPGNPQMDSCLLNQQREISGITVSKEL